MNFSGETNYVVPTYEYLQEWLDDSGMTRAELARRLDVSPKHVTKLLAGAPLTADLAARLELVSGVPARIWLQYETQYRADVVRLSHASQFAAEAEYLKEFPLSLLRKKGIVTATMRNPGAVALELLAFFRVATTYALRTHVQGQQVAFRQAMAYDVRTPALSTWLRLVELEEDVEERASLPAFDDAKLSAALVHLRALSAEPKPESFGDDLVSILHESGVQLIFVPDIAGARVFGATKWRDGRPIVALSTRGRDDAQFWFTLFHELGHVQLHRDSKTHVNPGPRDQLDPAEDAADAFANDHLLPGVTAERLGVVRSKDDVVRLAQSVGVSPGVVMGRLWHDKYWPHEHGRGLCSKIVVESSE